MEPILNHLMDSYKDDMVRDIIRVIRKKSVNDDANSAPGAPFGRDIAECLDEVIKIGNELGLQTRNYDGYAATFDYGTAGKEIGILAHMDVVPVNEDWTYPPFEGIVENGRIYGRGSEDDKGPAIACLYAMKAIRESGLPIRNHVRAIFGTDEEGGRSGGLKYYLTKEQQPWGGFSPDGSFPVIYAEKGIIRYRIRAEWERGHEGKLHLISVSGGTKVNVVPHRARAVFRATDPDLIRDAIGAFRGKDKLSVSIHDEEVIVEASGLSSHAMQPWLGDNAILTLLAFLSGLDYTPAGAKSYLDKITRMAGDGYLGSNMGIACEDALSGKLSHSLDILELSETEGNIAVDIRYPIYADHNILAKTIRATCAENGLDVDIYQDRPCLYVPKKDPLVQTLLGVYREVSGRNEPPIVLGGATYCRSVSNFLAYGPVFPGHKEMAHETDEFIEMESLMLMSKVYVQAIYRLLNL